MDINDNLIHDGFDILKSGLGAVHGYNVIRNSIHISPDNQLQISSLNGEMFEYDLNRYEKILIVGAGKAVASMARSLEDKFINIDYSGHIIVKYNHLYPLKQITFTEAGHPIPDENGIGGTQKIIDLIQNFGKNDLIIFLLAGGASSLFISPVDPISLSDLIDLNQLLINSGATISEINMIRKHISNIKGGKLAKIAFPATVITLIISDVINDSLDVIGSGPTAHDTTTFYHSMQVIDKYILKKNISKNILKFIGQGLENGSEKPVNSDKTLFFKNVRNIILANNQSALDSCRKRAESLNYHTMILTSSINGESREIAKVFSAIYQEIKSFNHPIKKPACILSGGETTVTVTGKGKGGRNQELVLSFINQIETFDKGFFLSCGTDGTDGPTEASGAYVNKTIIQKLHRMKYNPNVYLKRNDSFSFFTKTGSLIKTGPTHTNVMDLQILIVA